MAKNKTTKRGIPKRRANKPTEGRNKLYTLCVFLTGGPVAKEFEGKEISRTIQIRGDQTLEGLHYIIFKAFDREEEHMYEFSLGKGPYDQSARYSLPMDRIGLEGDEEKVGDVTNTTIESLGLMVGRAFGYWFDFGDDWMHQINVVAIDNYPGTGKYPKIIKRVGESPPQYPDFEGDEINTEEE